MRIVGSAEMAQAARSGHIGQVKRIARMQTGFPSPAEDMAEKPLRLDDLLVSRPESTFFVQMDGDALLGGGIQDGDVLVVDRALYATDGALVIVAFEGQLIARYYCPDSEALHLLPANPEYLPISLNDRAHYEVWGVVTGVVRRLHHHH